MRIQIFLFCIYAFSFSAFGQKCDCLKNMQLLQGKIEKNHASYQHQVVEQNRVNDYITFKTNVNNRAQKITNKRDCIGLVSIYLSFFRDEHAFMAYENGYKPRPAKQIRTKRSNNQNTFPFEGIWYFQDGTFSINVIPAKTIFGEWVAVIHESESVSWKKGQLKIAFTQIANDSSSCVYWRTNLIPKKNSVKFTDSTLEIGRHLTFYRQKKYAQAASDINTGLHFEVLSETTNYLGISSFDLSNKDKIDSLLTEKRTEILSKKNLIIDVRNNGGGGFEAFQAILPFVLDTNLTETPYYGSVWVSEENYAYYDQTKYEFATSKQDSVDELQYTVFLKQNLGRFTPIEHTIDTILIEQQAPSNIVILFNRNTASTAEGFILQAISSKKVKTFGENTKGAISYGDWVPVKLPELNIWVALSTKKMIFKNNEDLENIGISPDVDLSPASEKDWLNIVLRQLEK